MEILTFFGAEVTDRQLEETDETQLTVKVRNNCGCVAVRVAISVQNQIQGVEFGASEVILIQPNQTETATLSVTTNGAPVGTHPLQFYATQTGFEAASGVSWYALEPSDTLEIVED